MRGEGAGERVAEAAALLGPTLPNRFYWHAGTSAGYRTNVEAANSVINDSRHSALLAFEIPGDAEKDKAVTTIVDKALAAVKARHGYR